MLVTRSRVRDPFTQMQNEMDRLFGELSPTWWTSRPSTLWRRPAGVSDAAINVWEDDHNYFCELELPGLTHEDIDVQVVGNELTVKGQREARIPENAKVLHRERQEVNFTRTMTLPSEIKADDVQASMTDGVLLITLPKSEQATARRIEVKGGQST